VENIDYYDLLIEKYIWVTDTSAWLGIQ